MSGRCDGCQRSGATKLQSHKGPTISAPTGRGQGASHEHRPRAACTSSTVRSHPWATSFSPTRTDHLTPTGSTSPPTASVRCMARASPFVLTRGRHRSVPRGIDRRVDESADREVHGTSSTVVLTRGRHRSPHDHPSDGFASATGREHQPHAAWQGVRRPRPSSCVLRSTMPTAGFAPAPWAMKVRSYEDRTSKHRRGRYVTTGREHHHDVTGTKLDEVPRR